MMIVRLIKTFVTDNLVVITKIKIYCNVNGKSICSSFDAQSFVDHNYAN